jgi:hypothetical protein
MVEMESVILYSLLTESFPQVANNGWRQHPVLCHWQKKNVGTIESRYLQVLSFGYSVMVVLRKPMICWNIMFMQMEFICGVAMQMAQIVPCLGFLLYWQIFLMYFNWQSYFQSSEAEIHQNDQMRAWVMHGMFQGVLSDIVHYGSIFYYRREP